MIAHACHAKGCRILVPPRIFMCARHWRLVPRLQQARIWATYRSGQEIRKDPSEEYLEAARAAIATVEQRESALVGAGGEPK